jgi:hypothetical protein
MSKIDWYYIYSQRYYPHDFYLKETIPAVFQEKGIFIDQSIFDEHLYKHQNEHFFSRITVKVETILSILREKIEEGIQSPFFFTDVDIIIRPQAAIDLYAYTNQTNKDILFQQEYLEGPVVNPGVILIWPTENSLRFWEDVVQQMNSANEMEMVVINRILKQNQILWGHFDLHHVCSTITINHTFLNTFSVFHMLSGTNDRYGDMEEKKTQSKILVSDFEKYYAKTLEKYGKIFS